jgi:protein-S-isoprenylcysteine O-methyltransferase Ste14
MVEEERAMRTKKRSNSPASAKALAVANHAAMGIALGLVLVLILTWTPFFGVLPFINHSDNPAMTMATFVGTVVLMFGLGAALTGLILMMEEHD